jgi:UMF1 family MFS transporter
MMVRQADPEQMTQAFGLYALSGKATSFMTPLSIGIVTDLTSSQQLGILPLVVLLATGMILLSWVKPEGDTAENSEEQPK